MKELLFLLGICDQQPTKKREKTYSTCVNDTGKDRQTDRQTETEREKDTDTDTDRDRQTDRQTEID